MTTHRVYTTPLVKKLGIAAHTEVALLGAPDGFVASMGELPDEVSFISSLTASTQLALCLVRSVADLEVAVEMLALRLPAGAAVWLVHPKRTGRYKVDFNQNHVRDAALRKDLVDYRFVLSMRTGPD